MSYQAFPAFVRMKFEVGGFVSVVDMGRFIHRLRGINLRVTASRDMLTGIIDALYETRLTNVNRTTRFPDDDFIYLDDLPWRNFFTVLHTLQAAPTTGALFLQHNESMDANQPPINYAIRRFAVLLGEMSATLHQYQGVITRQSFELMYDLHWQSPPTPATGND